jgi:uncharacterized protein DUF4412
MSKSVAILACAALVALCSRPALAGVVITEQETIAGGIQAQAGERTLMVEDNKEKVVTAQNTFIIDLDKNVMYVLDPKEKSYSELPFPPQGVVAKLVGGPALHTMNFAKNGKSRDVAGYKCEEYAGSGKYMMAEFSIVSCVSNKAPGAAEYSAFQKAMIAKLKSAAVEMPSKYPDGVPLAEDINAKIVISGADAARLPPDVVEQLKKELAGRPPMVTKTELKQISLKKLGAETFRPPAGFTKAEQPPPGAAPGGHSHDGEPPAPGNAAPPSSAP